MIIRHNDSRARRLSSLPAVPPTQRGISRPPGSAGAGATVASAAAPNRDKPTQTPSNSGRQPQIATAAKMPPRTAAEASSPAVISLLGSADTLANGGHMDAAAATLERALDLEPRNPFIYQRLAAVRLAQGQTDQAEQMASNPTAWPATTRSWTPPTGA